MLHESQSVIDQISRRRQHCTRPVALFRWCESYENEKKTTSGETRESRALALPLDISLIVRSLTSVFTRNKK